jgi:flagellar biosynthesis/type III secretory pathway M-ring protein FliF/YscJ
MDTWLVIVLSVLALIVVIGIIYWVTQGKERMLQQRRDSAAEHRQEAQTAAQRAGEADVSARRDAEIAEQERERAAELQRKAAQRDPDTP